MKLKELIKKIKEFHLKLGTPYTRRTSVVSPLFPGQFNYCLDESNVFLKYGNLLDIGEENFQKIQPAIRLSDYEFFINNFKNDEHLGTFSLSTISGFHSYKKEKDQEYYEKQVLNMVGFLVEIGLDISRLKVTYFSGNDARSIEGSRKHDPQEIDRKIKVDYYIEEDPFKKTWLKAGLKESQLEPNNTRDNFLTSAWYVTRAPWGYRNEILYLLSDGSYLDIGTIERMTHYPKVITDRDSLGREAHYVTEVSPWELRIIVDAIGIERILQALEDKKQIWKIELFKPLIETEISIADIERIRILHRIFTDSTKKEFGSKNRRYKVNQIIRSISHLDLDKIISVLKKNSEIYQEVFPELKEGIENTIKEIQEYRKMQVDWKFKRQLKGGQKTK